MKPLFTKQLAPYLLGIFALVTASGVILSTLTDEYIILMAVKGVEFVVLSIIMLHVYNKYINPIDKAVKTIDELVHGNYRARVHYASQGMIAELNQNINKLARNLSELSIQEEMKTKQLLTVLNNTESGLALVDEKGYIHLVNRQFLNMFSKEKSDYIGYLYYDVIDNETIQTTVQEAFLYEKNIKHSFTLHEQIGVRYLEVVGAPIFDERNVMNGAVVVLYDITELKSVNIMRKDFIANVSHELKTPIKSISSLANSLLERDSDNNKSNQYHNLIYEESKRTQSLVEDLLTLSMLEKDDYHLRLTEVNLRDLIDQLKPMVSYWAKEKRINLYIENNKDHILKADKDKLKQVLLNLLGNAISYTPEYGVVSLNIEEQEEHIHINVTDNGIGIDINDIPRLFERFYRVDKNRSRNTGGTGLGLAIVKHIVEVHQGEILVDSKINEGSSFTVIFPKNPYK